MNIKQLPLNEEVELAPNLLMTRRRLLLGASISLAAACTARMSIAASGDQATETIIDFEELLIAANLFAEEYSNDLSATGQERYLHMLASIVCMTKNVPEPLEWRDSGQSRGASTELGLIPGGGQIEVLQWRMAPSAEIKYHAHTGSSVVTIGLKGIARIRNFEIVGVPDYDTSDKFKVQRTKDQYLKRGSINLMSPFSDNIRGIQSGPEGAAGLDFVTAIGDSSTYSSRFLEIDESRSLSEFEYVHEARWK